MHPGSIRATITAPLVGLLITVSSTAGARDSSHRTAVDEAILQQAQLEAEWVLRSLTAPTHAAPNRPVWKAGRKSTTDWRALIDATWGPGSPSSYQNDFYTMYDTINQNFACANGINWQWGELFAQYAPEVFGAETLSWGRVQGIISRMTRSVQELHTKVYHDLVVLTEPTRGVPLLIAAADGYTAGRLGAAVTALADGTGLVYRVLPDNPLGLEPGDRILGYDGTPWAALLEGLLAAELPIYGSLGSSPAAYEHRWVSAVGANAHLFDLMDVVKYSTGAMVQIPTALADGYSGALYGSEQLNVGIPFPDLSNEETVTWGLIEREGYQIGYIYGFIWTGNAGQEWYAAIDALTSNPNLAGLIIDFRHNLGGNMFLSFDADGLLFADGSQTIEWFLRCDPVDPYALCPHPVWLPSYYEIDPTPVDRFFDRPIAILTGPGAASSGDQVALRMTFHPEARVFGKTTNTGFNSPRQLSGLAYDILYPRYEAGRVDDPSQTLTHREFPVDEPVWLEQQDVADGVDTVVERAAGWILAHWPVSIGDHDDPDEDVAPVPRNFSLSAAPNPFNPAISIEFVAPDGVTARLSVYDVRGRLVATLFEETTIGEPQSIVWNAEYAPSGVYFVSLETASRVVTEKVALLR